MRRRGFSYKIHPVFIMSILIRTSTTFLVMALAALIFGPASGSASSADLDPFYGVVSQKKLSGKDFDQMAEGRIGLYRVAVDWQGIDNSGDGDYNWSGLDETVEDTARRGIKLMPTFYNSPTWLTYDRRVMPVWSGYAIDAWKDMLEAAVARYGNGGEFWQDHPELPEIPVTLWQIWNEPNIRNFAWPVSPGKYARLVKASAASIRSVDPGGKVVLGGMYGSPPDGTGIDAGPFLNRLYRVKGFRKSFDIAAVHPYAASSRKSLARIFPVRHVMNRHGNTRRPMFITELGWGSDSATSFGTGSQDAQATQVRTVYRALLRHRARLRLRSVIWFSWADLPTDAYSCSFCHKTGFFDNEGKAKPSWWALLDFTHGD